MSAFNKTRYCDTQELRFVDLDLFFKHKQRLLYYQYEYNVY